MVNLSIKPALVKEAHRLRINISLVASCALTKVLKKKWKEEQEEQQREGDIPSSSILEK